MLLARIDIRLLVAMSDVKQILYACDRDYLSGPLGGIEFFIGYEYGFNIPVSTSPGRMTNSSVTRRPVHFRVPVGHLGTPLLCLVRCGGRWRRGLVHGDRVCFGRGDGRGRASRQDEQ
jgi:hypothetical protein